MIYTITGKIGSGKTLLSLNNALWHLGKGGCVVSNLCLNEPKIDQWMKRCYKRRLVKGQLRFHDFEKDPEFQVSIPWGVPALPVMIIVDEAQLFYNSIDSAVHSAKLKRLLSFLTQSRKCSVDVWFITQADTTIWAQFRHQVLYGYKCRDMRDVNLPVIGKLPSLGLNWVKYDIMSNEILERGRTPLDRRIFDLYDTRQMYDEQMRELQKCAEIWQPVTKKERGLYETDNSSDCGVNWFRRLRFVVGWLVDKKNRVA